VPEAVAQPGPGRPSSGADERILEAALEVLKADGYAGLTTAKVAARSGHNKALIAYHFGSKQGLVAAAAREVSESFRAELLEGVGEPDTVERLARALADAMWRIFERDEGLARIYFDLISQAVVEPELLVVTRGIEQRHRAMLELLLAGLEDGPPPSRRAAAAVFLVAGLEGLLLSRLHWGSDAALSQAREMFVRSAPAAIRG
jgi:AcrR family transcriptional regulator